MKNAGTILEWVLRIAIAAILLQTLPFKFGADPQSVELFTKLGAEPFGRIGTGVIELIASILLFIPRTTWAGAGLALGTMLGAIVGHLTVLGVDYPEGSGLFYMAVAVFIMSAILLFRNKAHIPFLKK
ncbi:MAG: DoxX family protein [Saprospiraceae bacterium]|nr:DoxX family protein [Saprospiraceae bacterium]